MVGKGVEPGTGTASCIKRLAKRTQAPGTDVCSMSLQSLADGAIHSWGTKSRVPVDRYWGMADAGASAPVMAIKAENFIVSRECVRSLIKKRRSSMPDLPMVGVSSDKAGQHPVPLYTSRCMSITTPCLSVLSHLRGSMISILTQEVQGSKPDIATNR